MSKSKIITLDNLSLSNILNEDSELIPLMTPEDEELINSEEIPTILPILPLRNTVLFPGVVIPISAGRDKSIPHPSGRARSHRRSGCAGHR